MNLHRPRRFSFLMVSAGLSLATVFGTETLAACPTNAPVTCGEYCCPYGDDGRTDVCCANGYVGAARFDHQRRLEG